jgi:hypothetical protein
MLVSQQKKGSLHTSAPCGLTSPDRTEGFVKPIWRDAPGIESRRFGAFGQLQIDQLRCLDPIR